MKNKSVVLKSVAAAVMFAGCLFNFAVPAMAQGRDPNGLYGPSSQPGAGQRYKSELVLEAGKTMDRVIFIDVLELLPYDGPGGTNLLPGVGPYAYTLLNYNDGRGNHVRLGVVERPDDTGLMGVWHFDGDATDSSGNGHHGTISNPGQVTLTGGVTGMAYHFDGQGNIDVGNLDFSGMEYTVSLWARTRISATPDDYRMLIGKANIPAGDMTVEICLGDGRYEGGANGPIYVVWDGGITVVNAAPRAYNGRDGNWHMYTATYKNGSQIIYMDGVQVAADSYSGLLPQVAEGLKIGGFDGFGPYHHYWIGDIDEVYVYGRALSAAEVSILYGAAPQAQGPVLEATVLQVRQSSNRYGVTIRLANTGDAPATYVKALAATLGGQAALPSLPATLKGSIPAGGWVDIFVGFPMSAGNHGETVLFTLNGSFKGGGTGAFTHGEWVTLP